MHFLVVPEITQGPVDMAARVGESVTFTCTATGVPLPNITWSSDSSDSITATSDVVSDNDTMRVSQIMLSDLQINDFQNYTCTAMNVFGNDSETALLGSE